jgi:hypothetical protein
MKRISLVVLALAVVLIAAPSAAQLIPQPPELENRIPAPLPPPPQPPVIHGPATEGSQGYSPRVKQRRLRTQSDRVTRCLHSGAASGLSGAELDAYSRRCANAQ